MLRLIISALLLVSIEASAKPLWCERLLARVGLETSAVTLRPMVQQDTQTIVEIGDHELVHTMMSSGTREAFREFLEGFPSRNPLQRRDYVIEFGGRLVGAVSFFSVREHFVPGRGEWLEIGYFVDVPYWGLGIGRRALEEAIEIAFGTLRAEGLLAFVRDSNTRSLSLLSQAGFSNFGAKEGVQILARRRMGPRLH